MRQHIGADPRGARAFDWPRDDAPRPAVDLQKQLRRKGNHTPALAGIGLAELKICAVPWPQLSQRGDREIPSRSGKISAESLRDVGLEDIAGLDVFNGLPHH